MIDDQRQFCPPSAQASRTVARTDRGGVAPEPATGQLVGVGASAAFPGRGRRRGLDGSAEQLQFSQIAAGGGSGRGYCIFVAFDFLPWRSFLGTGKISRGNFTQ